MAFQISDNLIFVNDVTATEAARGFRALLDRVEREGESFRITRHGAVIAELHPRRSATGRDFKALVRRHGPDPGWWDEIERARAAARGDDRVSDPWRADA